MSWFPRISCAGQSVKNCLNGIIRKCRNACRLIRRREKLREQSGEQEESGEGNENRESAEDKEEEKREAET